MSNSIKITKKFLLLHVLLYMGTFLVLAACKDSKSKGNTKKKAAERSLVQSKTSKTADKNNSVQSKIRLIKGDITKLKVDVIVNAANESLLGGGGVDGAIHQAAGDKLLVECRKLAPCSVGDAKITDAYEIQDVKKIIHTVGPDMRSIDIDITKGCTLLRKCYWNSLEQARKHNLRIIAFPCISVGVYKFPRKEACLTALRAVKDWLAQHSDAMDQVIFCCFEEQDKKLYKQYRYKQ